jgi:hypothetical protein
MILTGEKTEVGPPRRETCSGYFYNINRNWIGLGLNPGHRSERAARYICRCG